MTNEINNNKNEHKNTEISLLLIQCHSLHFLCRSIVEMLKNPNDLTPEQTIFWCNYVEETNKLSIQAAEKGILLVEIAEAEKKAANLQASLALLQFGHNQIKAANAHLN